MLYMSMRLETSVKITSSGKIPEGQRLCPSRSLLFFFNLFHYLFLILILVLFLLFINFLFFYFFQLCVLVKTMAYLKAVLDFNRSVQNSHQHVNSNKDISRGFWLVIIGLSDRY